VFYFVIRILDLKSSKFFESACLFGFIAPLHRAVLYLLSRASDVNELSASCLALLQIKKIMNGVFQSLRGEFELEETYSGRMVLGVVMNTIKVQ